MSVKRLALIVSGDRNGTRTADVRFAWETVLWPVLRGVRADYDDIVLCHGACGLGADGAGEMRGVDKIADDMGRHLGFTVLPMPAPWSMPPTPGDPAGPQRNAAMDRVQAALGFCGYDELTIGCHNFLENSRGTKHMIGLSRRRGVTVRLVTTSGEG